MSTPPPRTTTTSERVAELETIQRSAAFCSKLSRSSQTPATRAESTTIAATSQPTNRRLRNGTDAEAERFAICLAKSDEAAAANAQVKANRSDLNVEHSSCESE